MICLGIDTAQSRARVALTDAEGTPAARSSPGAKTHSETLLVTLTEVLADAGVSLSDIGLVAVGLGPGAWTGLRIGITTAKALAYALSIPIVGVSSLEVIAAGVTGYAGRLAVVADARRGELYGAIFTVDGGSDVRGDGAIFVFSPPDARRVIPGDCALVGEGVSLLPDEFLRGRRVFPERFGQPDAAVLCRRATVRFERQGGDELDKIVPIYVRKSDAEINREKKEKDP